MTPLGPKRGIRCYTSIDMGSSPFDRCWSPLLLWRVQRNCRRQFWKNCPDWLQTDLLEWSHRTLPSAIQENSKFSLSGWSKKLDMGGFARFWTYYTPINKDLPSLFFPVLWNVLHLPCILITGARTLERKSSLFACSYNPASHSDTHSLAYFKLTIITLRCNFLIGLFQLSGFLNLAEDEGIIEQDISVRYSACVQLHLKAWNLKSKGHFQSVDDKILSQF